MKELVLLLYLFDYAIHNIYFKNLKYKFLRIFL